MVEVSYSPDRVWVAVVVGFVVFCIGGAAYAYMDFAVHGSRFFYDFKRSNPIAAYKRLIQEQGAKSGPVYVSMV